MPNNSVVPGVPETPLLQVLEFCMGSMDEICKQYRNNQGNGTTISRDALSHLITSPHMYDPSSVAYILRGRKNKLVPVDSEIAQILVMQNLAAYMECIHHASDCKTSQKTEAINYLYGVAETLKQNAEKSGAEHGNEFYGPFRECGKIHVLQNADNFFNEHGVEPTVDIRNLPVIPGAKWDPEENSPKIRRYNPPH